MNREDWNRRYSDEELFWKAEPNRFLVSEIESMKPGLALDLACGEGRNAIWLAERGWTVEAVDYSAAGLEKGRRVARERGVEVTFVEADLTEYLPPDARYDLVIVFYLQIPWDEMQVVIGRAAGAVASRGTFLLVGHDSANLEHGHGGPRDPGVLYTSGDVAALVRDLTVRDASRRERPVETEGGTAVALDCLVRAENTGD